MLNIGRPDNRCRKLEPRGSREEDNMQILKPIEIVANNIQWKGLFQQEGQRVLMALRRATTAERFLAVEHVGSTSVPGLGAKPVIDVMIGVSKGDDLSTFPSAVLTGMNYVQRHLGTPVAGIANIPIRPHLMFSKYQRPAINLHIVEYDGSYWRGLLAVRDYLRSQPKAAATYEHVKRLFAARYGSDLLAYSKAKRPFLNSLQRIALNQLKSNGGSPAIGTRATRATIRVPGPIGQLRTVGGDGGTGGGTGGAGSGTGGTGSGTGGTGSGTGGTGSGTGGTGSGTGGTGSGTGGTGSGTSGTGSGTSGTGSGTSGSPPPVPLPQPLYVGNPSGWQPVTWYLWLPESREYVISPDQNPVQSCAQGLFLRLTTNEFRDLWT